MLDHFYKLGYKNGDENFKPQESSKHGFCKLEKDGKFYFAKYSIDHSVRENSIIADIWWCEMVEKLRKSHGLKIKTPKIVEHSNYWYIAEWVEGKPSVIPGDSASRLDEYLEQYADCLAQLNKVEIKDLDKLPPLDKGSTTYTELDRRWKKWSEKPLAKGLLTLEELEQARKIIRDYQECVKPHLQHGDFTPWHILVDSNQEWWLIDGEHASVEKPRYYDLAYMYSRIYTRLHSPKHAARLVKLFIEKSKIPQEELWPAFLPLMTSRAIGMFFDALNDAPEDDYVSEAQDLLKRCLTRQPSDLLNI